MAASRNPVTLTTHLGPTLPAEAEEEVARFGTYLAARQIAPEREVPFWLMWVRAFLAHAPSSAVPDDAVREFVDHLAASGRTDWQRTQAERSVRHFLGGWREGVPVSMPRLAPAPDGTVADADALAAVRDLARTRHYSPRTGHTYAEWVDRYFAYLDSIAGQDRQPHHAVTGPTIRDFLSHLAIRRRVAASTQNQAFHALLFLGREVLGLDLGDLSSTVRAKRGERLPTVLSPEEVRRLLTHMDGTFKLMAQMVYGGGLRVIEICRLRVKDLDFDQGLIIVRGGKGDKDRTTLLPRKVAPLLRSHLKRVKTLHDGDLANGHGEVELPGALAVKYPNAGREWAWQFVFPSRVLRVDPGTGKVRRWHATDSSLQQAFKSAMLRAGIAKHASIHTLRHSFATHLLLNGVNIRQIQELLGHAKVETTMIYTHVVKDMQQAPDSPLDLLE